MAIRSGVFNSVNGDRRYLADFFAEYFASFISNGVFPNPSNNFQVIANGTDRTITLKPGKAWINGYYVVNDDDYMLQLEPADGVLHRIDRIVLQLNHHDREIVPVIKKGDFATSPTAKNLQRDADAHEIALADVFISKGSTVITQSQITDLRLNNILCGVVHGLIEQIDTSTLFNQYQVWFSETKVANDIELDEFKSIQEQEFNEWFDSVKGQLEGDVAVNLASRIALLENEFEQHQIDLSSSEVGKGASLISISDIDSLFSATTVESALKELFTNVSNGKNQVATAITDKGVSASGSDTFSQLANAISSIETGVKFAEGSSSGTSVEINNLDFKPKTIFVYFTRASSSYYSFLFFYTEKNNIGFNLTTTDAIIAQHNRSSGAGVFREPSTSFELYNNGFKVQSLGNSVELSWFAIG